MTKKQTKTPPAKRTARHAEAVAPWRDWARRLCEKSGEDWEAFERATATANGSAPGDFCGMLYDAAQGAFRDFPPAVAAAGLGELETAFAVAAGKPKTEGIVRRAVALNALPRTLRRLAESPAFATPPPPAPANATHGAKGRRDKPAGKHLAVSLNDAADKLGRTPRTLERYEANPGCVPDGLRGYCRKVRESWAAFNTWLAALGMHEGTQSMLRDAAEKLGGDIRGMRVGRRP